MRFRREGRQLTVAVMVSLEEEERQQKATADEHKAVNKWPQCTRAQIQKYTSTKYTNPQVHLTKFDQYKVQVLHKSKRWTQETQKARGADRSASSLDCSLCEDSQSQARCKKVQDIIQKKIEYRHIRSDEKKMMTLSMMMMMLMTMMMTIVAHTYTD